MFLFFTPLLFPFFSIFFGVSSRANFRFTFSVIVLFDRFMQWLSHKKIIQTKSQFPHFQTKWQYFVKFYSAYS